MEEIEIKRGYEVLSDNRVRFGIRITNNSEAAISNVEVFLDYNESLFELDGDSKQKLGNIPPSIPRTAKFILKPRNCVHKEKIGATIRYKDFRWNNHTLDMRSKEIHCVCPFLKEKTLTRENFLKLFKEGYAAERGLNFENISAEKVAGFITNSCKNRLYKVDEFPVENGEIFYLAGDSIGDKAYYLLTALVIEREGIVQVFLQAKSDKEIGIYGFLNEITENLRHLVQSVRTAREADTIKKEQVINIFGTYISDSVISGSTVGNTDFKEPDSILSNSKHKLEEANLRKQEQERQQQEELRRQREEAAKKREEEERQNKQKEVKEELERKKREAARAFHGVKQTTKLSIPKTPSFKKPPSLPKKSSGHSSEKIIVFSLIIGIFLIGAASFLSSSDNSDENLSVVQPISVTLSENTEENTSGAIAQTDSSQNPENYTNSISMDFVLIPSGEFEMGSTESSTAQPVHTVTIEESYYLGKYEVTQEQWKAVMGDNPSYFEGDDLPVENVSWNDAQEFIEKLNEMEGTDKYCLPSEAEWEYACRAGTTTRYSFGDDESKLEDYCWYSGYSIYEEWKKNKDQIFKEGHTHPVGQKKPNAWGLYDMHGNVWEWCQDRWHDNYDGAPIDGSAWEDGSSSDRVGRGGSWYFSAWGCRSAYRDWNNPGYRYDNLGFRVLRKL